MERYGSGRYSVRSVERTLSILKLFINKSEMNLAEITSTIVLPQSTTYRLLATLVGAGFIDYDIDKGTYQLGAICLALGDTFLQNNDLHQRAHKSLVDLRDKCGKSIHLGFLQGTEIVYLEKIQGLHPIGLMSSRVGGRAPVYCTGLGKAQLAYLSKSTVRKILSKVNLSRFTQNTNTDIDRLLVELMKIREAGYAIDNEEHEKGVGCIASPVFDNQGVVAAISISGPKDRILDMKSREGFIQLVKQAARDISIKLGENKEYMAENTIVQS